MERRLEGKVVLVTGAGVRLGRVIAESLGRAGAEVAVHFHTSERGAAAVVSALRVDGNRAGAFPADLTVPGEVSALVDRVEAELGPIAGLVNSAALFHRAAFVDQDAPSLDRLWQVNARAPFLLSQAVARRVLARGSTGHIVNVLDVGGVLNWWRNYAAYCMSKAALAALTRCLALELAPALRVNAVAPGTVLPPETLSPADLEAMRQHVPQGRFGTPEEVAEAVLFLLTGPAYVTGQILAVDGASSLARGAY